MAGRKRGRSADESAESGAISDIESAADGGFSDISKTKGNNRLSFQVTEDGRVDWDRVRDGTRAQLRKIMADPGLNRELGIVNSDAVLSPAPAANVFDASVCGYLFGAISSIKRGLAIRAGYSPAVSALAAYSQEEITALSGPASKVLNKHLGGALSKYPEEAELLATWAMIEVGKIMQLREADRLERQPAQTQ